MNSRSQCRASSMDSIGRCLPGSIRGIAKSFASMRYLVPFSITSNCKCFRQRRPFLHVRPLHFRLILVRLTQLLVLLHVACTSAAEHW
jgi:hypothetical protein